MKTKSIKEHRDEVMTHLKYIKEKVDANYNHLEKVNGRLNKAENNENFILFKYLRLFYPITRFK